jgi:uncharacterized hydrophobic protein (TIGR00341 family)
MALRLVQLVLPSEHGVHVDDLLGGDSTPTYLQSWTSELDEEQTLLSILIQAESAEPLVDRLNEHFEGIDGYRVIFLPVEATLPRPDLSEQTDEPPDDEIKKTPEEEEAKPRISREELYADVVDSIGQTGLHLTMVVLSTIVAAIGLVNGDTAVVIGAMVIAPLLGPNVALSLATTFGDLKLARRALRISLIGLAAALGVSVVIGLLFNAPADAPEIAKRTTISLDQVALALAAGGAGALAFTMGVSSTVVGVMVAVALLPPLVTAGLMIGSSHWTAAYGAGLLLAMNIICINLAGVATFFIQGIRPSTSYEAERARRATLTAMAMWAVLLAILVGIIVLSQRT